MQRRPTVDRAQGGDSPLKWSPEVAGLRARTAGSVVDVVAQVVSARVLVAPRGKIGLLHSPGGHSGSVSATYRHTAVARYCALDVGERQSVSGEGVADDKHCVVGSDEWVQSPPPCEERHRRENGHGRRSGAPLGRVVPHADHHGNERHRIPEQYDPADKAGKADRTPLHHRTILPELGDPLLPG